MGTFATYFRKSGGVAVAGNMSAVRAYSDPFRLRGLPNDELFFWSKSVDNSRLVRQADPNARGECWSALGAAAILLLVGASIIAPQVASVLAGYQLETLKAEYKDLVGQKRALETKEAALLSPEHLNELARANSMTNPDADQVFHLETQASAGSYARVQSPAKLDPASAEVTASQAQSR